MTRFILAGLLGSLAALLLVLLYLTLRLLAYLIIPKERSS